MVEDTTSNGIQQALKPVLSSRKRPTMFKVSLKSAFLAIFFCHFTVSFVATEPMFLAIMKELQRVRSHVLSDDGKVILNYLMPPVSETDDHLRIAALIATVLITKAVSPSCQVELISSVIRGASLKSLSDVPLREPIDAFEDVLTTFFQNDFFEAGQISVVAGGKQFLLIREFQQPQGTREKIRRLLGNFFGSLVGAMKEASIEYGDDEHSSAEQFLKRHIGKFAKAGLTENWREIVRNENNSWVQKACNVGILWYSLTTNLSAVSDLFTFLHLTSPSSEKTDQVLSGSSKREAKQVQEGTNTSSRTATNVANTHLLQQSAKTDFPQWSETTGSLRQSETADPLEQTPGKSNELEACSSSPSALSVLPQKPRPFKGVKPEVASLYMGGPLGRPVDAVEPEWNSTRLRQSRKARQSLRSTPKSLASEKHT